MRKLLADGRPAYVVFDDATLERIALAMPESLADLARLHGIGPKKLELYGDAVLVALEDARAAAT
jgi:superfamily II DNA helicase RecQ